MSSSTPSSRLTERYDRCPSIAAEWYQAIATTSYAAYSPADIRRRLTQLARQAVDCLFGETFASTPAHQIGAALADLHYTAPLVLGRTNEILARRLLEALPPAEVAARLPRLAALLGAITTGFEETTRNQVLLQQDDIQQAALNVHKRLHENLKQEQAQLAAANAQLQREINVRKQVEADLRQSEGRYRTLFENTPIALWEVDFAPVAAYLAELQASGIADPMSYFADNPEQLQQCWQRARTIDVNKAAVILFEAENKQALLGPFSTAVIQLVEPQALLNYTNALFEGKTEFEQESTNRTLQGNAIDIFVRWVIPRADAPDYAQIIVSVIDVTKRKKAERQLRRYSRRLQALRELDLAVLSTNSVADIARSALARMQKMLPYAECGIFLIDVEAGISTFLVSDPSYYQTDGPFPIQSQQLLAPLQRGETVYIPDLMALPQLSDSLRGAAARHNRSVLIVPLIAHGTLLGGLSLAATAVDAYDETQIETAEELAMPVALALQNAELLATEQEARRQAETLRAVANSLNSSRDLQELLTLILESLERVLPFDSASIVLYQDDQARIVAYQGLRDDIVAPLAKRTDLLTGIPRVLQEKRPLIIPDISQYEDWLHVPGTEHIRCWMGVPLIVKDRLLGVLTLDSSKTGAYGAGDAQLALAFASQAAVAIDNAQLYERVQRHADELERRVNERTRDLGALYEVTAVASEYLNLDVILDKSLGRVLHTLHGKAGTIHVLDEENQRQLRLLHHQGINAQRAARLHEDEPEASLLRRVVARNGLLLQETAVALNGTLSYLGTPMRARGQLLGVLSIFTSPEQAQHFTAEDLALLGSIADHIAVAVENDRLRRKAEQIAVVKERDRLGRDLHDSITQLIYSLTLHAEVVRELVHSDDTALVEVTEKMDVVANQALKEMRLLLYQLRVADLERDGFIRALENRLDAVEARTQLQVYLDADDSLTLPDHVAENLLRIAQEALNNTLKHAFASSVVIRIDSDGRYVTMDIIDDGRGFELDDVRGRGGMGLNNIEQRVATLKGHLEISTKPGHGTTIRVRIPLGG